METRVELTKAGQERIGKSSISSGGTKSVDAQVTATGQVVVTERDSWIEGGYKYRTSETTHVLQPHEVKSIDRR